MNQLLLFFSYVFIRMKIRNQIKEALAEAINMRGVCCCCRRRRRCRQHHHDIHGKIYRKYC